MLVGSPISFHMKFIIYITNLISFAKKTKPYQLTLLRIHKVHDNLIMSYKNKCAQHNTHHNIVYFSFEFICIFHLYIVFPCLHLVFKLHKLKMSEYLFYAINICMFLLGNSPLLTLFETKNTCISKQLNEVNLFVICMFLLGNSPLLTLFETKNACISKQLNEVNLFVKAIE